MRDFIGDRIRIDGRMIGYKIFIASEYLIATGMTEEQVNDFIDNKYECYILINQIIAIKQSCWLLRRTSYSCQSLSDDMYNLKIRLIRELKDKYDYDFDDDLMEQYCG